MILVLMLAFSRPLLRDYFGNIRSQYMDPERIDVPVDEGTVPEDAETGKRRFTLYRELNTPVSGCGVEVNDQKTKAAGLTLGADVTSSLSSPHRARFLPENGSKFK